MSNMSDWQYHNIPMCKQTVFAELVTLVRQENIHMMNATFTEDWISAQVLISPVGIQLIARYAENKS
jgi:hypothetical protein